MSRLFDTPAQALREMLGAGASFAVHARDDALEANFTFRVRPGGDLERCRQIIADIQKRPSQFGVAFREAVRVHVREEERR